MATLQRIGGSIVVEPGRSLPGILPMTVPAVLAGKLPFVGIVPLVTGAAEASQAQIGPAQGAGGRMFLQNRGILNPIGRMAFPAAYLCMGTLQGKTGGVVGEGVGVHPDEGEV
jgi:hypothetical protein